ncbi:MAG: hypothetical protein LBO05_04125 [Deltaproteobacteria bacterium]|jgi:hypothetical protein|nr:hypothetical protein [Deltaproteobacteria bacterium]
MSSIRPTGIRPVDALAHLEQAISGLQVISNLSDDGFVVEIACRTADEIAAARDYFAPLIAEALLRTGWKKEGQRE